MTFPYTSATTTVTVADGRTYQFGSVISTFVEAGGSLTLLDDDDTIVTQVHDWRTCTIERDRP